MLNLFFNSNNIGATVWLKRNSRMIWLWISKWIWHEFWPQPWMHIIRPSCSEYYSNVLVGMWTKPTLRTIYSPDNHHGLTNEFLKYLPGWILVASHKDRFRKLITVAVHVSWRLMKLEFFIFQLNRFNHALNLIGTKRLNSTPHLALSYIQC